MPSDLHLKNYPVDPCCLGILHVSFALLHPDYRALESRQKGGGSLDEKIEEKRRAAGYGAAIESALGLTHLPADGRGTIPPFNP
jgi:hypothetical protein